MHTTKTEKEYRILRDVDFLEDEKYKVEDCYSDHDSSFNQTLHFHDFYEMSIIYEGESGFLINGTALTMPVGSLQLIRPSDYHKQTTEPDQHIRYYNLTFQPDVLSTALQDALLSCEAPLFYVYHGREWRRILELARALWEEYQRPARDAVWEDYIRSGIALLCTRIFRSLQDDPGQESRGQKELLRQAIAYVHQHYREKLALKDVADHVGLSPAYFSSFFHQSLGVTFSRYLTDYRLRMAAQYLGTSDFPLKQIADICGFSGYAYFLTAFRERYGLPPAKYRKKIQGK